jgi:ABC-2 type transport system permease protein
MGKSKISVIIAREFSVRVKKKSFILTTVLVPLFFAACMIVPVAIMFSIMYSLVKFSYRRIDNVS